MKDDDGLNTAVVVRAAQAAGLPAKLIEHVVVRGDLTYLTPDDRMRYYDAVCTSMGLNPLTQPFAYIQLNGKLMLYAKKDCTEQLRRLHGVSVTDLDARVDGDLYIVTAKGRDKTGRTDASQGAVSLKGLTGEGKANAIMKAETKAKRRLTLSICGLGMLDETETETIVGAVVGEEATRTSQAVTAGPHVVEHVEPPKETAGPVLVPYTVPDEATLKAESAALFPMPEPPGEREDLLLAIEDLADQLKLSQDERLTAWKTYCKNKSRAKATIEDLRDLLGWLQARAR